jgi:hypothetical protein
MNAWSNIEVAPGDAEVNAINALEQQLGDYVEPIRQIRELITRFEVCHFKYQQHLKKIKESIRDLHPHTEPGKIGQNHVQHGEDAWKSDKTGRSFMGQQYLWVLDNWLDKKTMHRSPEDNEQLSGEVQNWLGERNPEKERLVRLLKARLKWDWQTLEELSHKSMEEIIREGADAGLEYQINRMDICHFAFPVNLINVIRGIGKGKPVERFEGCGTHNTAIRDAIHAELVKINKRLSAIHINDPEQNREDLTRIWLLACLAKTMKAQAGLREKLTLTL